MRRDRNAGGCGLGVAGSRLRPAGITGYEAVFAHLRRSNCRSADGPANTRVPLPIASRIAFQCLPTVLMLVMPCGLTMSRTAACRSLPPAATMVAAAQPISSKDASFLAAQAILPPLARAA
jgi:hypothetical protein